MTEWSTCYGGGVTNDAPRVRADAARNRELVLAAAEQEFADRGRDASVSEIAHRAGVAKGTVFRHFSSKEDLVAAVVRRHFSILTTAADRLATSETIDPERAIREFLTLAAEGLQKQDLDFLQETSQADPLTAQSRVSLHTSLRALLQRARAAGAVRDDVTATDLLLLLCAPIHAVAAIADPPEDLWRRYLGIILDGLRPEGASPLPAPPPTW